MKAAPKQAENVAVGSLIPSSVPATYICCTSLVKLLKFMKMIRIKINTFSLGLPEQCNH